MPLIIIHCKDAITGGKRENVYFLYTRQKEDIQIGKARIEREERDGQTCLHGACSSLTVWAEPPVAAIAALPAGSEQLSLQTLSKRKPSVQ